MLLLFVLNLLRIIILSILLQFDYELTTIISYLHFFVILFILLLFVITIYYYY